MHYVERPIDVTLSANKNRDKVIPESLIREKMENIDIPTRLECHELKIDCPL